MWSWKKRAIKKYGQEILVQRLMAGVSFVKPVIKFILLMLALSFLIAGITGPQVGSKLEEVKRSGVDIMIALDVSNSMKAEDIRPSRLERSRQAISHLIDQLKGDRIGIIVFAGEAYVQLPITTDYGAAKLFLSTIDNDIVPTQGTAIGKAIDMAAESFNDSTKQHNAIIVITDGENHEDDAVEAAKTAHENGIRVYTIGMGSAAGAPIPVFNNNVRVGFKQDENGQTVISKLDEITLARIAEAGNGKFVRATNSDDGLGIIMKEIGNMQKKEFSSKMYTDYEDQFQYFLFASLLFLLLEFVISEKKSKWLQMLNLFGENKLKD
jgi:Ca-activated chloride channel family protein